MVDNDHSKCVKCYSSLNCSHFKWKEKKKKKSLPSPIGLGLWLLTEVPQKLESWESNFELEAVEYVQRISVALSLLEPCAVYFSGGVHTWGVVFKSESSQCNLCQLVKVFLFTVASVTYKFSQWAGWHSSGAPSLACLFKKNRHAIDLLLVQFYSQSTIQCTRHSFSLSFLGNTHIIV